MKIKTILISAMLTLCITVGLALAATSNPSPASPGYTPLVLPISGIYSSASVPGLVKFKAPAKYRVATVNVAARTVTGTNPTMKVLLKSGAFTNYSGTLTAAATPTDLTAGSTTIIADESTVAVDLVLGGTTPKFRDLTLFILLKRL